LITNPHRRPAEPTDATVADIGEFGLIQKVTAATTTADPAGGVLVGPGDDAAVLDLSGPLLTSIDVLVENVHFRRSWSEPDQVARKAIAANVADIEAMGGRAVAVTVGFSAPGDLPASWVDGFAAGLHAEAELAGVQLVGGDVTSARDVTVAVSVLGVLDGRAPVLRSGAGPDQVVAICGRVGWAAAGLLVLSRGFRSPRAVVEAYRVPQVPYGQGAVAATAGATALIDVSDGLVADLGHVAAASGVSVALARATLELPEPLQAVGAATGKDPYELLLAGGEDHALAGCFPDAAHVPAGWVVVGTTQAAEGTPEVLVDGVPWEGAGGWDHFANRPR
jgi:thiamine-monophosphate kinase